MNLPAAFGAALIAAIATLLSSCAIAPPVEPARGAGTYVNPVLDRDFPDPAVLRDADGWFYAYATQTDSNGRTFNIQVARSRDLVNWQYPGEALPEKPRWAATKQLIWAPHVVHDPLLRRYFMYFSAEPDRNGGKCLAVATANLPTGPFTDSGEPLLCGEGFEHIDPMAFDDPATGKHLLYWGSGAKPIRVRELAPDRLHFAPGSVASNVLFPDEGAKYRSLIEGAWVIHRHGSYYLFFSGDRCCGPKARYALMVARARDALGPFEALAAPVVVESSAWRAPGHNSVIADDAGTDWILYHAMRLPPQREMLLDRIVWQEGWPRVEGGQPSNTPRDRPAIGLGL
jgi:arabinan endo-1,5-alpha-L-arabinosidase